MTKTIKQRRGLISVIPLASLDAGGHIIYVGSFCKSIAPGIRIGFMVAPEIVVNEAAAIRKLIDRQANSCWKKRPPNSKALVKSPGTSKDRTISINNGWIIPATYSGSNWVNIYPLSHRTADWQSGLLTKRI